MLELCTMFDGNFVLRGMALLHSLRRQSTPFRLWLLCTDDSSLALFSQMALPDVRIFGMSELERAFPDLLAVREERSPYEYIATAKPYLLQYVMNQLPDGSALSYLDADLGFFADPSAIMVELGNHDILLTPHGFPEHLRSREVNNGRFNAGFFAARKSAEGMKAIQWWCDRCREWCFDRVEDGKSSNQKYLDQLPGLFPASLRVSEHPGLNLAPWNIDMHAYTWQQGRVHVDGRPLVFFHFHGLKRIRSRLWDTGLASYHMEGNSILTRRVYRPYLKELSAIRELLARDHNFEAGMGSVRKGNGRAHLSPGLLLSRLRRGQWLLSV